MTEDLEGLPGPVTIDQCGERDGLAAPATAALAIIEDIEVIIEQLAGAYSEAEDAGEDSMVLRSNVKAKFRDRVERVQAALFDGRISAK